MLQEESGKGEATQMASERSLRPTKRLSASARACRELRRRIATGAYTPNSFLPSEREMASDLGVGRTALRSALDGLVADGLLVKTKGLATRVLPPFRPPAKDAIAALWSPESARQGWPFAGENVEIMRGARDTLSRLGHRFELLSTELEPLTVEDMGGRFAGAVFLNVSTSRLAELVELDRRGIPLVVANIEVETPLSGTWVDHRKATGHAVRTLVALGHRRIAFLGRDPSRYFYGRAREGYLAGLEEAGIEPNNALILETEATDRLAAYRATKPLLDLSPRPTAIVAARDVLAHGACEALADAGLAVGRDVSVIGFDDCSWPQEEPFLTTFHEPCYEMGATAVEVLMERIVGGCGTPGKRELEAPFILRRSAGPAPAEASTR